MAEIVAEGTGYHRIALRWKWFIRVQGKPGSTRITQDKDHETVDPENHPQGEVAFRPSR